MRAIAILIFIACSMHTAYLRATDPIEITFPMSISADGLAASDKCEGLTYCTEQPEGYPQKLFNKMYRNAKILQQPFPVVKEPRIVDRSGADSTYDQCPSNVTYPRLYLAREYTNQPWKFVIQVVRKMEQHVRIETCIINKESGELPKCFEEVAGGEGRTECHQNYMSAQVLTYDVENKKMESTRIQLPSCCSCGLPE